MFFAHDAIASSSFAPGQINNPTKYGSNQQGLGDFINNAFATILTIAGLAFLVYLVIGGIKYLTAGGDSKAAQSARDTITHALLGLIIVASIFFIALIVQAVLGINILSPVFTGP